MSKEAMKMALEVLKDAAEFGSLFERAEKAIKALEEALAKQEGQSNFCPQCEALARELKAAKQEQDEPVGTVDKDEFGLVGVVDSSKVQVGDLLYTAPQPKQEQGEPVAIHQYRNPHCSDWYDGIPDHHDGHGPYEVRTLYTTPQQRKPLTDEQIRSMEFEYIRRRDFARAIEAAHGIKE